MKRRGSLGRRALGAKIAALLATSLAAGLAVAAPADARPTREERFTVVSAFRAGFDQPVWSTLRATGAFADRGSAHFGADGPGGVHHDIFVLSRGTIDLAELSKTDSFTFNQQTCIGSDHETGTYQLTGTGDYADATGRGAWHHDATIIAPLGPGCTPSSPQTVGFVRSAATGRIESHPDKD